MLDFYAFADKVFCFKIAKIAPYLVTLVYEKIAKLANRIGCFQDYGADSPDYGGEDYGQVNSIKSVGQIEPRIKKSVK